jgi:hypothetical protein
MKETLDPDHVAIGIAWKTAINEERSLLVNQQASPPTA